MNEWMNDQMNEWMNEWLTEWLNEWTNTEWPAGYVHKQWTATLFLRGCLDLIDLSMKRWAYKELTTEGSECSLQGRQDLKQSRHTCRRMQKLQPPRQLMLLSWHRLMHVQGKLWSGQGSNILEW